MEPEAFGDFTLLDLIGKGGMGETYVAERRLPPAFVQRVCVKRMLEHLEDEEWEHAFQIEAGVAAQLRHPNIVTVFDSGQVDDRWWMSMELVEGLDLSRLVRSLRRRSERLPIELVLFIAWEIAEALTCAHALRLADGHHAGLVHRDIKPANILLGHDGSVKLTDFGVAKHALGLKTRTGRMKGTPPYMSPEQASLEPIDARSDLFALGVMLFELVAGARPFEDKTDLATLLNIQKCRRTSELPADTDPVLAALIHALIERDPNRRPRSADAVLDALGPIAPTRRAGRVLGQLVRTTRSAASAAAEASTVAEDPTDVVDPTAVVTVRERR